MALACTLFMVRGGIDPARVNLHSAPLDGATPAPAHHDATGRSAGGAGKGEVNSAGLRRMIALSDGSRQLLSRIIRLPPGGTIERIEVAMAGRGGRTRIKAEDFKLAALGHVVPYPDLVTTLRAAADRLPFSPTESGAGPASAPAPQEAVTIHADGMPRASSTASAAVAARDFNQAALLTEVMAENGGTTAYECFGEHGPLALLPAAAAHTPRYAVVWCDRPELSAMRAAMTPAQLSAAVNEAVCRFAAPRTALGALQVCAPAQCAPLSRLRRAVGASGREVWIGNAAQSLHPVAGQGLNLGLRDAFELARMLADNEYSEDPRAPEQMLARFAAVRRLDRSITTGVTDLLASVFTWPLAQPLQSLLLTAMDMLPPLRRPLASTLLFGLR